MDGPFRVFRKFDNYYVSTYRLNPFFRKIFLILLLLFLKAILFVFSKKAHFPPRITRR